MFIFIITKRNEFWVNIDYQALQGTSKAIMPFFWGISSCFPWHFLSGFKKFKIYTICVYNFFFIHQLMDIGFFLFFGYYEKYCCKHLFRSFFVNICLYLPWVQDSLKREIPWMYGALFTFLRNCLIFFSLADHFTFFYQQCTRLPNFPHPYHTECYFKHSNDYKLTCHYSFDLYFPNN
jgi:hypothetical protein